jgi:Tfp pilus assembly protein PilF
MIRLSAVLIALSLCQSALALEYSTQVANTYVARQDWQGLIAYVTNWSRAEPKSAVASYYLGTALFMAGRTDETLGPLQRATVLDPRMRPAWQGLGNAYDRLGRFAEAAKAYEHCLDLSPHSIDYWDLVVAYLNAGRPQQARTILERQRSAPVNPQDAHEWHNIGLGFDAVKDPSQARAAYQRALQLDPKLGPAWNNLGVIEQLGGSADQALQDYRRAASLGEPLGASNAQNLENGLNAIATQNRGSRQVTPQMVREMVRQGQAKAWQTNHPESIAQPFGHP